MKCGSEDVGDTLRVRGRLVTPRQLALDEPQEQRVEGSAGCEELLSHILEACAGPDHLRDVGCLPGSP